MILYFIIITVECRILYNNFNILSSVKVDALQFYFCCCVHCNCKGFSDDDHVANVVACKYASSIHVHWSLCAPLNYLYNNVNKNYSNNLSTTSSNFSLRIIQVRGMSSPYIINMTTYSSSVPFKSCDNTVACSCLRVFRRNFHWSFFQMMDVFQDGNSY